MGTAAEEKELTLQSQKQQQQQQNPNRRLLAEELAALAGNMPDNADDDGDMDGSSSSTSTSSRGGRRSFSSTITTSATPTSPLSMSMGGGEASGSNINNHNNSFSAAIESRTSEAARQLLCGGVAGAAAKTLTAPFSRLTILFQVHSMVTTKVDRPAYALSLRSAFEKVVDRGGVWSLWRGNLTSVLHRFPYSAINFYVYENTLDALSERWAISPSATTTSSTRQTAIPLRREEEGNETPGQLVRRVSKMVMPEDEDWKASTTPSQPQQHQQPRDRTEDTPASHKFIAGATAGTMACLACYPLDLVRTRLTTQLEGAEHYRGIVDAFTKIARHEGLAGFYSGVSPTLAVAVPNFAISYTVYGTLKEYTLDDDLFYNLRRIDADSGEPKLGTFLTVLCGAASGILATCVTFPMDTVRRRMQIQALHVPLAERLNAQQHFYRIVTKEGLSGIYRGLTPELLKVVPMVGTMFMVYEWTKELLNVRHNRT